MARVPYVAREDLPESQRHIYDEIASSRGRLNVYEALLNSPEAAACVGTLGAYLRFHSQLPSQIRELAILTVARELGCDYEWAQHQPFARSAGVSETSIAAIHEGIAPKELPNDQAVVVCYVQEILHHHRVTGELFDRVLKLLGTKDLIDLTLLIGYYTMTAFALLALNVEIEDGTVDEKEEELFIKE